MKAVLQERGICTDTLIGDQMKTILASHDDFKSEKPKLICYLCDRGHSPKFSPELNPIERVWARVLQVHTRSTTPLGLDSVGVENIRNFHRKCRHYMFAHLVAGQKIEDQVINLADPTD